MDTTQTTHLSLCSGYGGIDLGLHRAIPNLRTIAYSEIEAFAIENLLARMEGGQLDPAPIWPNLKTFPWRAFSDRVDILSGGYPCQPFSAAGKRLGTDDPRHLWPFIADGIRLLRPKICFFENVEGHISLGLREVIGELGSMGYSVSWGIFSAREVGAPHQRKRVFILAHSDRERGQLSDWWRESAEQVPASNGQERRAWPSRHGQPQYAFEPPRVVGNADCFDRRTSTSGWIDDTEAGSAGEIVGDSEGGMPRQSSAGDWREGSGGASDGRQLGDTAEQGREGSGRQNDSGGTLLRSSESDGSCANRPMESEQWQTKSTLGGDADGTPSGMDYAELCVSCDNRTDSGTSSECGGELADSIDNGCDNADSRPIEHGVEGSLGEETAQQTKRDRIYCSEHGQTFGNGQLHPDLYITCDNRTDELRLLGNGVVPATATLAFQTLLAELLNL